jgi:hypothetical protein
MKWEYRIEELGSKSGLFKEAVAKEMNKGLAEIGEQGWELVGMIPTFIHKGMTGYSITQNILIFQRPRD